MSDIDDVFLCVIIFLFIFCFARLLLKQSAQEIIKKNAHTINSNKNKREMIEALGRK